MSVCIHAVSPITTLLPVFRINAGNEYQTDEGDDDEQGYGVGRNSAEVDDEDFMLIIVNNLALSFLLHQ